MTAEMTGAGEVGPGRGGRMSRQRKTAAVMRLLRGEGLETASRAPSAGFCRPRLRRRIDDDVIDGRHRGDAERVA